MVVIKCKHHNKERVETLSMDFRDERQAVNYLRKQYEFFKDIFKKVCKFEETGILTVFLPNSDEIQSKFWVTDQE